MRTSKRTKFLVTICCVLAATTLVGGFVVWAAVDNPTPIPRKLHYEGYLEKDGVPVNDTLKMKFILSSKITGSFYRTDDYNVELDEGHFAVDIPTQGQDWIFDQAGEVSMSILINGVELEGEQKLTAAPFAVRAAEAVDFKVKRKLEYIGKVPQGSMIMVKLSNLDINDRTKFDSSGLGVSGGPYEGWAICNGDNGTLDLNSRFIRLSTAGSGGTGGNDTVAHTHSIAHQHSSFNSDNTVLTTAQMPSHTHTQSAHSHTQVAHTHTFSGTPRQGYFSHQSGDVKGLGTQIDGRIEYLNVVDGTIFQTADVFGHHGSGNSTSGDYVHKLNFKFTPAGTISSVIPPQMDNATAVNQPTGGNTGHNHLITPPSYTGTSGSSGNLDNRPAYVELVPLCRI